MNRIRKLNNTYQCLLTPHRKYDTGFEFIIGSWTDESIKGFEVKEFDNYNDAENAVFDYPDINWIKLVEFHKDSYDFLRHHIMQFIHNNDLCIDFKSIIMTPDQVKNIMFDRVIRMQEDDKFRLVHNMNDIITFIITNPWTHNLNHIAKLLVGNKRLRIFKKMNDYGIIHLIGKTDINTTYEIILTTSILHNWITWKHSQTNQKRVINAYKSCIEQQKIIDSYSPIL